MFTKAEKTMMHGIGMAFQMHTAGIYEVIDKVTKKRTILIVVNTAAGLVPVGEMFPAGTKAFMERMDRYEPVKDKPRKKKPTKAKTKHAKKFKGKKFVAKKGNAKLAAVIPITDAFRKEK
jgi:hypothetical protein